MDGITENMNNIVPSLLPLHYKFFTSLQGAICLDGSPPGYYWRPGEILDVAH